MTEQEDTIEDLPGVGPSTAGKLRENGFSTFEKIAVASPSDLSRIGGLGEDTAIKAIDKARDELDLGGFQNGLEKSQEMENIRTIAAFPHANFEEEGPAGPDAILGSGIESQCITEIHGEFGAGKSQITHMLCVSTQLPEKFGGVRSRPIFIDTEDTFRPARVRDFVRGLDDEIIEHELVYRGIVESEEEADATDESLVEQLCEDFLEKVHTANAYNSAHQITIVDDEVPELARTIEDADDEYGVGVVIVDSLTAHFRSEYVGRGQLAKRQQKLNQHLRQLNMQSDQYNCAVVVTNQVTANPDSFFGGSKAIGGNVLAHTARFRINIKKKKGNKRVFNLINSPHLEQAGSPFTVETDGLKPQ